MPSKTANRTTAKTATSARKRAVAPREGLAELDLLKNSLGYELKLAQVRATQMLFEALDAKAISPARLTALSIINSQPGISQALLADRLSIARPSVVKVVDMLEAAGLVERQAVPDDRRSYALVPTAHGRVELRDIGKRLQAHEAAIAAHLSAADRKQLMSLLAKVAVR
jgi:MarR family transcriptional regulator, temperature-dependent positive regulator of motility